MNNILKTASIVTSGILVGAFVRKFAQAGLNFNKQVSADSIKGVKKLFMKGSQTEDINNYFI